MTQKEGGGRRAVLSHPLRREGRGGEGMEGQREGGHGVGHRERDRGTPPGSGHSLSQASVGLSWQNKLKSIMLLVVGMGQTECQPQNTVFGIATPSCPFLEPLLLGRALGHRSGTL